MPSDSAIIKVNLPSSEGVDDTDRMDAAREIVLRTRETIDQVKSLSEATLLVHQSAAAEKMMREALKACRFLEREQFELRQEAAEAHLRTQRCAGELLAKQTKHPGGRPPTPSIAEGVSSRPSTLRELGIDVHESHRWQRLASIPAEQFEEFIAYMRQQGRELTSAAAIAVASQLLSQERPRRNTRVVESTARGEYYRMRSVIANLMRLEPRALAADLGPAERANVLTEASRCHQWWAEFVSALTRN
jgi:hypothetical protein